MPIEIRQTTITTANDGDVVQIHISDAPPGDESAAFVLTILAKLPHSQLPILAQMQREAVSKAQNELSSILQRIGAELTKAGHELRPRQR